MAAPVRHRIELYAVRKLHLVLLEKATELALRLFSSPEFVRLCFSVSFGDQAIKLDAVAGVIQGSSILQLRFGGRQCICSAFDLA